jgi:hypothetical protein
MKIHTITHKTARRDGKPIRTYKLRYEEVVRDPATGLPTGAKRSRSETYPSFEAADARRREIESERAATGSVTGREARLEPFAVYAALWVGEARDAVAMRELKARTIADREGVLRRYVLPRFAAVPIGAITRVRIEASRSDEVGLSDLVACVADHAPGTSIAATRRDNRIRQIKSALDKLTAPGLGLIPLPNSGRRQGKYADLRLRDENGDRKVGPAVDYLVPEAPEPHLSIPVEFYLNGWIHALTHSEIAAWLMFRDLRFEFSPLDSFGVHISGDGRVDRYCLSRDVWNSHTMLVVCRFSLWTIGFGTMPYACDAVGAA